MSIAFLCSCPSIPATVAHDKHAPTVAASRHVFDELNRGRATVRAKLDGIAREFGRHDFPHFEWSVTSNENAADMDHSILNFPVLCHVVNTL
jgi:hypothetical protein